MKKTLVALAVLAASGASFAQVSLTGAVWMGYSQTSDRNANTSSGFGVDTATINFGVTEDLGGGMKLTANQGFDTLRRGSVIGGDTTMSIGTSAYTVGLTSILSPDTLGSRFGNVGGLAINGWDGRITSARVAVDGVSLTIPMGAFTVAFGHSEVSAGNGGLSTAAQGINVGAAGSTTVQRATSITGRYSAGNLNTSLTLAVWDAQPLQFKDRVIADINYDFGVAKVGAGVDFENYYNAGTRTDAMVSVGVPIGALTLGANFAMRKYDGTNATTPTAANADATYNGGSLSVTYALSKQSSVRAQYQSWSQFNASAAANANNSNQFEVVLAKSF